MCQVGHVIINEIFNNKRWLKTITFERIKNMKKLLMGFALITSFSSFGADNKYCGVVNAVTYSGGKKGSVEFTDGQTVQLADIIFFGQSFLAESMINKASICIEIHPEYGTISKVSKK